MQLVPSLFLFCGLARGIYFYVPTGGPEKCFGEEAYPEAVVHVSYTHENQHGVICTLSFKDQTDVIAMQRTLTDKKGSVAMAVPALPEKSAKKSLYAQTKVCIKCPGSRWTDSEPQKFSLKIDVGGRSLLDNADDGASASDVRSVESVTKQAIDRIAALTKDSEFERVSEGMWRNESEKTYSSVQWLNVVSLVVIVVVAVVQAISLKHYFKREKLIF